MAPSAPVMVHPSWVQTASIAENVLALVRAIRNTPAVDSTSTAPPTSANADPAAVTCTTDPVNRPDRTPSLEPMPLGDVGDDVPPAQAENSVASVAPEATWQAPAQNRRRETGAFVSDIAMILVRAAIAARGSGGQNRGHSKTTDFPESEVPGEFPTITDWGLDG